MNNSRQKISAIIPCYNSDKTLLDKCIRSILAQNYNNYEIIVVDDGSDNEHVEILKTLKNKYNFILILEKHLGVSHARNVGTKVATGDYLTYIDSDDFITNNFFDEAIRIINKIKVDYLIGGIIHTKDAERGFYPDFDNSNLYYEILSNNKEDFKQHIIKMNFLTFGTAYFTGGPVARFIRKNLASRVVFNENIYRHEDCIWNCELLDNCSSLAIVYSHWYVAYKNVNSTTRTFDENMYRYQVDAFNELLKHIDFDDDNQYYAYVTKVYAYLCSIYNTHYKFLSNNAKKVLRKNIYTEIPWKFIGENRFFRLSSLKNKFHCIFYKLHFSIFERMVMDCIYKIVGKEVL